LKKLVLLRMIAEGQFIMNDWCSIQSKISVHNKVFDKIKNVICAIISRFDEDGWKVSKRDKEEALLIEAAIEPVLGENSHDVNGADHLC